MRQDADLSVAPVLAQGCDRLPQREVGRLGERGEGRPGPECAAGCVARGSGGRRERRGLGESGTVDRVAQQRAQCRVHTGRPGGQYGIGKRGLPHGRDRSGDRARPEVREAW